jgi:hypothetical protein
VIPRASVRRAPPYPRSAVGGFLGEGDNSTALRFRNAPGYREQTLKAADVLKRLAEIGSLGRPGN